MGKIKATQRLIVEDFPEQKDWIGKLFYVVNRFITEVIAALNGNIVFEQNITGQEHLFDFKYVSDAVSFPLEFKWNLSVKPKAFDIVAATVETSTTSETPMIAVAAWQFTTEGNIRVTRIHAISSAPAVASLTASSRYRILVRVTP